MILKNKKLRQKIYSFCIGFCIGLVLGIIINTMLIQDYSAAYYLGPNVVFVAGLLAYQLCELVSTNCYEFSVGSLYLYIVIFWGVLVGSIAVNKEQWLKILLLLLIVFGFSGWVTYSMRSLF